MTWRIERPDFDQFPCSTTFMHGPSTSGVAVTLHSDGGLLVDLNDPALRVVDAVDESGSCVLMLLSPASSVSIVLPFERHVLEQAVGLPSPSLRVVSDE